MAVVDAYLLICLVIFAVAVLFGGAWLIHRYVQRRRRRRAVEVLDFSEIRGELSGVYTRDVQ